MLPKPCGLHGHAGRLNMDMLVADLGGTQSRFFRFSCEDKEISVKEGVVLSSRVTSFEALFEELFSKWPDDKKTLKNISVLIFAAAGPVRDGRIFMTNAPFVVDEAAAKARFPGSTCLVMNDFEAQAWACLSPVMRSAERLISGRTFPAEGCGPEPFDGRAPVAVVGAGTGLGAAWLMPEKGERKAFVLPSEAGHVPFPFEGGQERDFADFLTARRGAEPTAEHVLSGPGLALLYEYLEGKAGNPAVFTAEPGFAESSCCRWFARFYGRFCRMAALALLPQALVVTGGVAGRTPALVRHEAFACEFLRARGEQKTFLESLPVWLNAHPQAGLWGAARAGAAFAEECGLY